MGDGHGLFDMLLGSVGMLIFNGGRGTFFFGGLAGGGGGRVLMGDGSSSTIDWNPILMLVLGNRNTHLKHIGTEWLLSLYTCTLQGTHACQKSSASLKTFSFSNHNISYYFMGF